MVRRIFVDAFDLAKELNPGIIKKVRVFAYSEPYILRAIAAAKNFPMERRNKIIGLLYRFHEMEEGREILELFKVDKFEQIKETEIDNVKTLIKEYNKVMRK